LEFLTQHIESLIFATEHPINKEDMLACLEETFETPFKEEDLDEALEEIRERYKQDVFAFELVEIAKGYQFLTKGAYHNTVGTYLKQTTKKRLSRAALETLALVAYKQPVSKSEMEKIRGVSCDYSIQKLLEKELVTILGRADSPGRPLLYGTTEKFMDYFGIQSLKDLPKPKDFRAPDSEVGEAAPIEEDVVPEDSVALESEATPASSKGSKEGISQTEVSLEALDGALEEE
jgi:segregation and condensation protein B